MTDLIPIPCLRCGERWQHPACDISVVLLPGDTDHVWFTCPHCGPGHIELDHCSAALIIYVYEPHTVDCTIVNNDDLLGSIVDLWAVEQAGQ